MKGVIFDLDGTLADTLPLCYAAYIEAFTRFTGRTFTTSEIRELFGPSEEGIIRRVVPDQWEHCLAAYLEVYEREHERLARVFPGVQALLTALRRSGRTIGVATGKGAGSREITLRLLKLRRYIDTIKWGSPHGIRKTEAILEILGEWAAAPEEVPYVGDFPVDMQAARAVGVVPVGAEWAGSATVEELRLAGAVEIFRSPEALLAWLDSFAPRSH